MVRVCFICLGNICRSPTAEAVMKARVKDSGLDHIVKLDSAGTGDWHVGEQADRRSRMAAKERGYDITSIARSVTPQDYATFDYLIAMDQSNLENLKKMEPPGSRARIQLLREFDAKSPTGAEVPDPYFGDEDGFEKVLDICEAACDGLLLALQERIGESGQRRA